MTALSHGHFCHGKAKVYSLNYCIITLLWRNYGAKNNKTYSGLHVTYPKFFMVLTKFGFFSKVLHISCHFKFARNYAQRVPSSYTRVQRETDRQRDTTKLIVAFCGHMERRHKGAIK